MIINKYNFLINFIEEMIEAYWYTEKKSEILLNYVPESIQKYNSQEVGKTHAEETKAFMYIFNTYLPSNFYSLITMIENLKES